MPWWGILLLCIGSAMIGATLGVFAMALAAAAKERDN
jgi:hypothetical protein